MIAILLSLLSLRGVCQGRKLTAGIDAGAFMKGQASIHIGYGFSPSFSAHADAAVGYSHFITRGSALEKEHDEELGQSPDSYSADYLSEGVHLRYWPHSLMTGTYLLAGVRYRNTGLPYCEIGIGYRIRIWKGLGIEAGYRLNLTGAVRGNKITGEGFTTGLYYTLDK